MNLNPFKLSPQAITLAVIYSLVLFIMVFITFWFRMFTPMSVLNFFITIMFFVLILYDTNCLTKGECYVWSWIRTILYAITPIVFICYMIWLLTMIKRDEISQENKNEMQFNVY